MCDTPKQDPRYANSQEGYANQAQQGAIGTAAGHSMSGLQDRISSGANKREQTVLEYLQKSRSEALRQLNWYEQKIQNLSKQDMYLGLTEFHTRASLNPPYNSEF